MAVTILTGSAQAAGINYSYRTSGSADWSSVPTGSVFYDQIDQQVRYRDYQENIQQVYAFPFTGSAIISGSLIVTGSISATAGVTASLQGTASWAQNAVTASYITGTIESASFATTASFAISASRSVSASFATTASFVKPLQQNVTITGNVGIGTTTPDSKLTIAGGIDSIFTIKDPDPTWEYSYEIRGNNHIENTPVFSTGLYYDVWENATIKFFRGDAGYVPYGGFITFNTDDGTERMRIANDGRIIIQSNGLDGKLGIGTTTPNYLLELYTNSAGKPGAGGLWTVVSDERLKENIFEADYDTCYDVVKNLPLKRYTWKSDAFTEHQVSDRSVLGWIAQDVESIFPKAVNTISFTGSGDFHIDDCKNLDAGQIHAAMYGTIKKLITENETLKSELTAIKTHLGI